MTSIPNSALDEAVHKVSYLTGGRTDEKWTAQCSCGKRFESTHNYRLRTSITRHLNKVATEAGK